MASTLADIQLEIAAVYDFSSTAPAEGTDTYERRRVLINASIRSWAQRLGYKWSELHSDLSLTTTADQAYVDLPSSFNTNNLVLNRNGEIQIGGNWYKFIKRSQKDLYEDAIKKAYVVGNAATGFKLYIEPTPTDVLSIDLSYYTTDLAVDSDGTTEKAALISAGDYTKCPSIDFVSKDVLSALYRADSEMNQWSTLSQQAEDILDELIASNVNVGDVNSIQEIPDAAEEDGYPAIGD